MIMARLCWKPVLLLLVSFLSWTGGAHAQHEGDPHYTAAGFFDTHVCNWPERPRFLMALFSTPRFDEVARVAVFTPDGRHVGDLDITRFRAFKTKAGQAKRAFITNLDLPADVPDGWYRGEITLKDGSRIEARDYVIHHSMAQPANPKPAHNTKGVPASMELSWDPIPGAKHYKVYMKDVWAGTEAKESPLLNEPRFQPPAGWLAPGGEYSWRIHARDLDGNILLGDFNHGTLGPWQDFTVE